MKSCKELMYQRKHWCRERERPGCIVVKVSHMLDPFPSWYAAPSSYKVGNKKIKPRNILFCKSNTMILSSCYAALSSSLSLSLYIYIYIYTHTHNVGHINDRASTILLLQTYLVSTWPCSKHKTSRKITPVETFNASKNIG